jgi:hypothetical protein
MIEIDVDEMFRTTNPNARFNPINQTEKAILDECNRIANFLIEKNRAYGNSFEKPISVFSKSSAEEQIYCRIDDKLNRIASNKEYPGDDSVLDTIGYLILLRILRNTRVDN